MKVKKQMKVNSIDRETLRFVRDTLRTKLNGLIDGVHFSVGNIRFTTSNATIKLEMALTNPTGEIETREKNDWKRYAAIENLPADGIGKQILVWSGGERKLVEIQGFAARSHKYPILAKIVTTGKVYKFTVSTIKAGFDLANLAKSI